MKDILVDKNSWEIEGVITSAQNYQKIIGAKQTSYGTIIIYKGFQEVSIDDIHSGGVRDVDVLFNQEVIMAPGDYLTLVNASHQIDARTTINVQSIVWEREISTENERTKVEKWSAGKMLPCSYDGLTNIWIPHDTLINGIEQEMQGRSTFLKDINNLKKQYNKQTNNVASLNMLLKK